MISWTLSRFRSELLVSSSKANAESAFALILPAPPIRVCASRSGVSKSPEANARVQPLEAILQPCRRARYQLVEIARIHGRAELGKMIVIEEGVPQDQSPASGTLPEAGDSVTLAQRRTTARKPRGSKGLTT